MSQSTVKPASSHQSLPVPVTANTNVVHRGDLKWGSVAPTVVALSVGLAAVSPNQSKATLLFVGASIIVIGLYFIILPTDDEFQEAHPIVTAFLRKLPDVLTVTGSTFIMLGIGFAFPDRVLALASLYMFALFAGLPALKIIEIRPRIAAIMYGLSLVFLVPFVVLTCTS